MAAVSQNKSARFPTYRTIYEAVSIRFPFLWWKNSYEVHSITSVIDCRSRVLESIESEILTGESLTTAFCRHERFWDGSLLTFAGCEGAHQSRQQHAEQQEQGTRFRPHRVRVTVVRRSFVHLTSKKIGLKKMVAMHFHRETSWWLWTAPEIEKWVIRLKLKAVGFSNVRDGNVVELRLLELIDGQIVHGYNQGSLILSTSYDSYERKLWIRSNKYIGCQIIGCGVKISLSIILQSCWIIGRYPLKFYSKKCNSNINDSTIAVSPS